MNKTADIEKKLSLLFEEWCSLEPDNLQKLPNSGSNRIYYRIKNTALSAIGVYNDNYRENEAFINFSLQFRESGINVPEIYSEKLTENIYLIQDLGNTDLLSYLNSSRKGINFPNEALEIYKNVIRELVKLQITAGRNFDYSKCYPYKEFDENAIKYDLNYFRTKYVDASKISYNKNKLDSDFNVLSKYLLKVDRNYFMFRDFQARNILLINKVPFFIDYQGGRKGALQYDLVSLIFQAKAMIPEEIKNILLDYYISIAKQFVPINTNEFIEYYFAYALIRVLQTLGAYGLRGLIENKSHFIESIPLAINNLVYLKDKVEILNQLTELKQIINQITIVK